MRRTALLALALSHGLLTPAFGQAPAGPAGTGTAGTGTPPPPPSIPAELTPEEERILDEVEAAGESYLGEAAKHRRRIIKILKREYEERLAELRVRYAQGMESARQDYRARHLSAIEELERFLAKYPNDPAWTPDVMFRLAELYLDQAGFEYEERQKLLAEGKIEEPPPEEIDPSAPIPYDGPDYTRSIGLWRDILKRFPTYRQVDGTIYLLGYYLGEMLKIEESKQAFLGLVCPNKYDPLQAPPPKPAPEDIAARIAAAQRTADPYDDCAPQSTNETLIDEAWVRIGEMHFDSRGELPQAIAAYKRVAAKKGAEYYDEALYKLAWSYYRNDQFMEGIKSFDELVVYADRLEDEGKPGAVELRKESIEYIAISFADPWEIDAQPDPAESLRKAKAFYDGRMTERHVRDVFEKLGDVLRIGEAYEQAANSWRVSLDHWPLHPRSPIVHQKIVDALADSGNAEAAMEERQRMAELYKKGSEWYKANETDREAMENATRLAEHSLLAAAKSTHRKAQLAYQEFQQNPDPMLKDQYMTLYSKAAELYQRYLGEYPTSSEVYELTYRMADTLFFSEQYIASVEHYRWVRDHKDLGTKYFEPSALSIVQAYQAAVDKAKAEGRLVEPPLPTPEALAQSSEPLPIPDLYQKLQRAYDEYMELIDDQKTAPKMALASAMVSYRHLRLDDALSRFKKIMDRYCQTPEAVQAKDGMLVIYQARGDDARFKETIDAFVNAKCGEDKDVELAKAQRLSKEYEIAAKLYKDGNYEAAGEKFYYLYKTAPATDENRDDALFSAAVAYEKAGKPKTAIAIYKEFASQREFRDSEYYVESLYRTAVSYQNAFDYDQAVDTYLRVVDLAGDPNRKSREEFDMAQARLDALWNAGILREQDRVYYDRGRNDPGAATLFRRYAREETKDKDRAMKALFRVALVYEKANDNKNMMDAFKTFRSQYAGRKDAEELVVLSYYKTAKALEKKNDRRGAQDFFEQTIKAFDRSGLAKGSDAAELAAEAQFWLAERVYRTRFEPYKVKWLGNIADRNQKRAEAAVEKTLNALQKISTDTAKGFQDVIRFESSWTLAALVRLGDISFFAGQKLIEAPVPKEITRLDRQYPDLGVLDTYYSMIEERVQPQTDAAKDLWEKVVTTAKQKGVANEWSKLANERLNAYIAADLYPVMRDELTDPVEKP